MCTLFKTKQAWIENTCNCSCDPTSNLNRKNRAFILYIICQAWQRRTPTPRGASREYMFPDSKNKSPGGKGSASRLHLLPTEHVSRKGLRWAFLLCLLCVRPRPLVLMHGQPHDHSPILLSDLQGLPLWTIKLLAYFILSVSFF